MSRKNKQRRTSRRAKRQQQVAQARRRRWLIIGGVVALIVLMFVAIFAWRSLRPALEGLTRFSGVQRSHNVEANFPEGGLPPVGGVHPPSWQTCGIYNSPVEAGLAVHSMEHGAVWIAYHPELPVEEVNALKAQAAGDQWVLMSPYPDLDAELVLNAWSVQLSLDSADDERIAQFIARYRGRGPEGGVSCLNGVGAPTG